MAAEERLEKKFVEKLKQMKLTETIDKSDGRRHVCFIGPTSAGKSTILNDLFDLTEKVGLGSTTDKANPVFEDSKVVVWDVPGVNNDWESFNPENLCFFHNIDYAFVLYDKEPKENKKLLKILEALNRAFTLVRTKCDNWKPGDIKTVE